jgi:shikimate kinase
MEVINGSGISIFLNVSLKELLKRLEPDGKRPLLMTEEDPESLLRTLYENRIQTYKQATFEIDGLSPSIEDVLKKLNIRK